MKNCHWFLLPLVALVLFGCGKAEDKPKEITNSIGMKLAEDKPKEITNSIGMEKAEDKPKEITNSIGMKLVRIPKGTFMMGSPETEDGRFENETQHEVTLTKDFYLGVYEVTQEEYAEVLMGNCPGFQDMGKRLPVQGVSWEEAVNFCKKLSELPEEKKAGRVYRLPTEAQWEYACRAGTTTPFHFGTAFNVTQANCRGNSIYIQNVGWVEDTLKPSLGKKSSVGSYPANKWGLHDMHGNVPEWCSDRYAWPDNSRFPSDYGNNRVTDPQGAQSGDVHHVLRGGSYFDGAKFCRAACRFWCHPAFRFGWNAGFRVLLPLDS